MRLLLCLMLFINCFSQTKEIDSLRLHLALNNIHDTVRANTLCQLSWVLGDYDASEGVLVGKKALEFSSKKGYIKNTGVASNAIAYNLNMLGRMNEAVQQYHNTIKIWKKLNDTLRIAKTYSNIGNVYSEMPLFDSAKKYYNESIKLCIKHKFKKPLSSAYLNLASLYISKNRFDESIKLLLESLKLKEDLKDDQGIANVCSHISAVYKEQKNYIMALKYAKQAFSIWNKIENLNGMSYAKMQLGLIYFKLMKYDSALVFTSQALVEFEKINNQLSIATGYNQLGMIYSAIKQYTKAILNFEKAKINSTNPFITETYVVSNTNLAVLYLKKNEFGLSKKNLDTALKYTNTDIQKNTVKDIYNTATEYYTEINDYKSALYYNKLYNAVKDSLVKDENFAITTELQLKHETEKKENENQKLKLENNLKNAEILFSRKRQNWIIFFGFFFTIALLSVFYFITKSKQVKQQLKEQDLINQTAFETEQQERARIASELHDGVGQKLSVVKMQLSSFEPDIKKATEILDSAIQDVRNASHNIMPNDIENGLVIAVENLVEQINYTIKTTRVNLKISENFKKLLLTKKHELYLYRIIQEIVNNSIKHSEAKNIHINMDCSSTHIKLFLADDGLGFTYNQNNKSGLGLKNIKNRVEQLKGKLTLNSDLNKGTSYNIEVIHGN